MKKIIKFNIFQFISLFLGSIILRIANFIVMHTYQSPTSIDILRGFLYDFVLIMSIILISDILIFILKKLGYVISLIIILIILVGNYSSFLYVKTFQRLILPVHLTFLGDKEFVRTSFSFLTDFPKIFLFIILPLLSGFIFYYLIKEIKLKKYQKILYFPFIVLSIIISLTLTDYLRKKIYIKNVYNSHYLYSVRVYLKKYKKLNEVIKPTEKIVSEVQDVRKLLTSFKSNEYPLREYPLLRSSSGRIEEPVIRNISKPSKYYYKIKNALNSKDRILKPNIIIFLLESFRAVDIGVYGSELGLTPVFDKLAERGILFTDFFAAGRFTRVGIVSTMASIPSFPSEYTVLRNYPNITLVTLSDIFKKLNYKNYWFYSGDGNFDNLSFFCSFHKFDKLYDYLIFSKDTPKEVWGYSEKVLMKKAVEYLNKSGEPFFAVVQTVCIHEPYDLPSDCERLHKRIYDKELENLTDLFHYTDEALGIFFNEASKAEWFKRTIFVITADEAGRKVKIDDKPLNLGYKYFTIAHKIPLLILGPGISKEKNNNLGYQIDIGPTILNLIGVDAISQFMGEDLLSSNFPKNRKFVISNCEAPDWVVSKDYILAIRDNFNFKLFKRNVDKEGEIDFSEKEKYITKTLLDYYNIWRNKYHLVLKADMFFPKDFYKKYY